MDTPLLRRPDTRTLRPLRAVVGVLGVVLVIAELWHASPSQTLSFAGYAPPKPVRSPIVMQATDERKGIKLGDYVGESMKTITEESDPRRFKRLLDGVDGEYEKIEMTYKNYLPRYRGALETYEGYVYRGFKKYTPGRIRIRMQQHTRHLFRMVATPREKIKIESRRGRHYEFIGHWDTSLPPEHPQSWSVKANRAVFWLREGAKPTDMVASFLDIAGIIRRTGPLAKAGEWEWRVPEDSIDEAPQEWLDWYKKNNVSSIWGGNKVKWGHKAWITEKYRPKYHSKGNPLIERHGFRGYERIPLAGKEPVFGQGSTQSRYYDTQSNAV